MSLTISIPSPTPMPTSVPTPMPFSNLPNKVNIFCDIIDHYKNANEDTRFFVLFHRREFSIKIKFKVLADILVNLFVSAKVKDVILGLFCKSQRVYYALARFAHKYQFRRASVRVDTDLCLNPIDAQHKKTIPIFDKQLRSVYLFTCQDLTSILMTALTHATHFFIEPRVSKNPYTNMPLSKTCLYNIYFHIQETYPVIPPLLQAFFMCDFDIDVFLLHNEHAIRIATVHNFLKTSSIRTLYVEVLHMLHLVHSKWSIDSQFPEHTLVDIMRPYLYLYMMFMYSITGSEQRCIYYLILKKKLGDFFTYNSMFGRKWTNSDQEVKFNCDYPVFTMKHIRDILQSKKYMQWYSYWNTWDIPTPYTSQLRRLQGYSPTAYRTDVDYEEDEGATTTETEEQEETQDEDQEDEEDEQEEDEQEDEEDQDDEDQEEV